MTLTSMVAELDVLDCPLDGISLIEASAGTGKTYNICGLYLRLLLERGLEVQQILVVTFTNSATAELRDRIRARIAAVLQHLHGDEAASDRFIPRLVERLLAQGLRADKIKSQLDLALQTFDEAAIFTIHGFSQRALGDTPFAAGLPLAIELVPDDAELTLEAARDFWRRHLADDKLDPDLAATLIAQGDSPDTFAKLLRRHFSKPLARHLWPAGIDDPLSLDREKVGAGYTAAKALWHASAEEVFASLQRGFTQLNGTTYNEKAIDEGRRQWNMLFAQDDPLSSVIQSDDKLRLYRSSVMEARKKSKCTPPAHPFFELAEEFLAQRIATESALATARLGLIRSLLDTASSRLRAQKRAQGVAGFDDMLFNLHERLTGGASPWLGALLKARFPAALIDEFQDTDPLQFEIFHAIYGADSGHDTAKIAASLFLVGDPKQAIYSFRHADLHTYLRAKKGADREYSLAANQRASRGLIDAMNRLFGVNQHAFVLDGLDYHTVSLGDKPRHSFVDHTEARADLQVWMLPGGEDLLDKAAARASAASATAAEIARLIAAGMRSQLLLDGRAVRAGDIAVLVRSHAHGKEMKHALARLNVGSVELSQASVFRTVDAEDIERLLVAVLDPLREPLLRAALATGLLGLDARDIEMITQDASAFTRWQMRFFDYRELWLRRGVGVMLRKLLADERVSERLLACADGERHLTNLLHLGELLHQATEAHTSPAALLRWLQAQRSEEGGDDAVQLRLESDQNLVQIVTIHKSKGLEYPIVFCPFLWDGRVSFGGGSGSEGRTYHDQNGDAVVDFRGDDIEKSELDAIKRAIKTEESAEFVRLLYVALTRAAHRCYLVAGCYTTATRGNPSPTESTHSLLNWLVAGQGLTPEAWFDSKTASASIESAWLALANVNADATAASGNNGLRLATLPTQQGVSVPASGTDPEHLVALILPRTLASAWRVSSYSGLSQGATHEQGASDHDAYAIAAASSGGRRTPPEGVAADDVLRFPRGSSAGDCVHAAFECMDFSDKRTWPVAIDTALSAHPQALPGLPKKQADQRLTAMLGHLLSDVTATELIPGLRLADIGKGRRLVELEFNIPAPRLLASELNRTLQRMGYPMPRLAFGELEGYLKGFIDLVFEHDGRFYILDWKSNHLGYEAADYSGPSIAGAMALHGYHLQYLLYTVALDRYLQRRIPDYHYDTHFGGVLYLFVRGVRPEWKGQDGKAAGVYWHRPPADDIASLQKLLQGAPDIKRHTNSGEEQ